MNLDRPVQFRRAQLIDDGLSTRWTWNDADPAADNHGPVHFAAKRDLSDGERWRAGEEQAHVTTRFTLRWSPFVDGITPKDRLVCDGVTYEITGKKDGAGRRRSIEFTCAARNDQ